MDGIAVFNDIQYTQRIKIKQHNVAFSFIVEHCSKVNRYRCNVDLPADELANNDIRRILKLHIILFGLIHQIADAHAGRALERGDVDGFGGRFCAAQRKHHD